MSPASQKFLGWLGFDEASNDLTETLEYEMRGPLYAASAILKRRPLSGGRRILEGQASARLPFRKKHEIEVRAETDAHGVLFVQEEFDLSKKTKKWWRMSVSGVLTLEGASPIRISAPVQSGLGLLFAIADSAAGGWKNGNAALFVAGKYVMAIRLTQTSVSKISAEIARFDLSSEPVAFMNADWPSSHILELEWDAGRRVIAAIDVSLPIFGRLRIRLARHERV